MIPTEYFADANQGSCPPAMLTPAVRPVDDPLGRVCSADAASGAGSGADSLFLARRTMGSGLPLGSISMSSTVRAALKRIDVNEPRRGMGGMVRPLERGAGSSSLPSSRLGGDSILWI